MVYILSAAHIATNNDTFFTDFVHSEHFFILASINKGSESAQFHSSLAQMCLNIENSAPKTLREFSGYLDQISTALPHLDSFAACFLKNNILYIQTRRGALYIKRENNVSKIIDGDKNASGYAQENDVIFLTLAPLAILTQNLVIEKLQNANDPSEIVESIKSEMDVEKDVDSSFATIIFTIKEDLLSEEVVPPADLSFDNTPAVADDVAQPLPQEDVKVSKLSFVQQLLAKIPPIPLESTRKKILFASVIILFFILLWSVVFGFKRRQKAQALERINVSKEVIDQKLLEAQDVSILNLARSQILILEARQEFATLEKNVGTQVPEEMSQLKDKIAIAEKDIVKKEEKKPEVFFDLQLIKKEAMADALYKQDSVAFMLNGSAGEVYVLDLEKKSIKTIKKNEFKGATDIAATKVYEPLVYHPQRGVMLVRGEKVIEAVKKDDEWGTISDMATFNSNLYIVDSKKDEIYKYLVAQDGYTTKSSYVKGGESIALSDAATISIDSALYVTSGNKVFKFLSGIKQDFSVSLPNKEGIVFDKIYTAEDVSKLYLLNKGSGTLFVLSKTGEYEKQIDSAILKKADDFAVSQNTKSIYILVGSKLYSLAF